MAAIKLSNAIAEFLLKKQFFTEHTIMNKMTDGLLFLLPLTLTHIELRYSGAIVCGFATIAAVQEGYYIRIGREI